MIDEEISFLEERIKELSNESMEIKEHRTQSTPGTVRYSGIGASGRGVEHTVEENYDAKGARPKTKMYAKTKDSFELYDRKDRVQKETTPMYLDTPDKMPRNITSRRNRDVPQVRTYDDQENTYKPGKLKPATYDGSTPWVDYKSHFNACACLNHWSEAEQGMYLAVSLRGQAQGVLGNMAETLQMNFSALSKALEERFSPANQTELYRAQLRERRQKASETIPQLGQDVRRLTRLAYPTAPADVCETLAKDYFIDALTGAYMRLRIKQSRPQDLNDAIRHAEELGAKRKKYEETGFLREVGDQIKPEPKRERLEETVGSIKEILVKLQKEINDLKHEKKGSHRIDNVPINPMKCYNCGKPGHIKRNCRLNQSNRKNDQKFQLLNKNKVDKPSERKTGSSGHFKKATHRMRKPTATRGYQGSIGVQRNANEPGMYVRGNINDIPAMTLVDTGTTVTLVSREKFEEMNKKCKIELAETNQSILSASGPPLQIYGKAIVKFKFGDKILYQTTLVADMTVDAVLGLDCLKAYKGIINL